MRKKIILLVSVLVVIVAGIIFVKSPSKNTKETTTIVRRQDLSEKLSFSGKIAANEDVILRFQTSGRLNWVGVKTGDYVKKYQTIAALDQREVQDNLKKYLNSYLADRWTLDQTRENYLNVPVSPAFQRIIDQAQFSLNSAVLDVQIKNLAIEYSNLWTPIEGIVVNVDAPQAGVNITPTQAEFEIINPNSVYFSATADQTDVVKLTASQSADIILDAFPDQTLKSSITSISFAPKSGETGTVYEVKMALPVNNSNYQYRLGMTGDVEFITRQVPNILAISTKLIKSNPDGTKYVWMKDKANNKVKQIVTLGEVFDNQTEIKSGLTEGALLSDQ